MRATLQSQPFEQLAHALQALPGIGPKTASRLASHLLQHDRPAAQALALGLNKALEGLHNCSQCNTFTELKKEPQSKEPQSEAQDEYLCHTCADTGRDDSSLCVVESIADQLTIEQTLSYRGKYFVLMGRLSPLDGMGAGQIGLAALITRAQADSVKEVILANRFSVDGEATAHVIAKHLKPLGKKVTRLAKGIPVGVELEYVDLPTLAHALRERRSN